MTTNTCRNCDKPIPDWSFYCSNVCEDMDSHPAPRDARESLIAATELVATIKRESMVDFTGVPVTALHMQQTDSYPPEYMYTHIILSKYFPERASS